MDLLRAAKGTLLKLPTQILCRSYLNSSTKVIFRGTHRHFSSKASSGCHKAQRKTFQRFRLKMSRYCHPLEICSASKTMQASSEKSKTETTKLLNQMKIRTRANNLHPLSHSCSTKVLILNLLYLLEEDKDQHLKLPSK